MGLNVEIILVGEWNIGNWKKFCFLCVVGDWKSLCTHCK